MKHIYAMAIDGPIEKPNGTILVRIIGQSELRFMFRCEMVSALSSIGRLPAIGAPLLIHESRLKIAWQEIAWHEQDVDSQST